MALSCLCKDDEDRGLWIDAICINQYDLDERSSQVANMEHIYRDARLVVVFLGEFWLGCDAVIDMMMIGSQDST